MREVVETAVKAQTQPCPHCQKPISLAHVAIVPVKQILTMKLTSERGQFSAATIGGVILEFDKLLKAVAKDAGGKVHTFIDSIERTEKDLSIGFLITSVQKK